MKFFLIIIAVVVDDEVTTSTKEGKKPTMRGGGERGIIYRKKDWQKCTRAIVMIFNANLGSQTTTTTKQNSIIL